MKRHLFFICPADNLEPIINNAFKYRNYYYTSLGNSVEFNEDNIDYIISLIRKHNIKEISFVLSNDNPIIFDALSNQNFSKINGLDDFYHEMIRQEESTKTSWQTYNHQYLVLSYFLNKKIKELQFELKDLLFDGIKISGKIYNQKENVFTGIYFDLIEESGFNLN